MSQMHSNVLDVLDANVGQGGFHVSMLDSSCVISLFGYDYRLLIIFVQSINLQRFKSNYIQIDTIINIRIVFNTYI